MKVVSSFISKLLKKDDTSHNKHALNRFSFRSDSTAISNAQMILKSEREQVSVIAPRPAGIFDSTQQQSVSILPSQDLLRQNPYSINKLPVMEMLIKKSSILTRRTREDLLKSKGERNQEIQSLHLSIREKLRIGGFNLDSFMHHFEELGNNRALIEDTNYMTVTLGNEVVEMPLYTLNLVASITGDNSSVTAYKSVIEWRKEIWNKLKPENPEDLARAIMEKSEFNHSQTTYYTYYSVWQITKKSDMSLNKYAILFNWMDDLYEECVNVKAELIKAAGEHERYIGYSEHSLKLSFRAAAFLPSVRSMP